MTKDEKKEMLEEAQELIVEALGLMREATDKDAYVEAYACAPLSVLVGEGIYVSRDLTLETIIEEL